MSTKSINQVDAKGKALLEGYLRKLKTMKKKYFVLRGECEGVMAGLEYYDTEKKYRAGLPPKRAIQLKLCFNINRRLDTKHKHVIALYTRDDVFCVLFDSDRQLEEWLRLLLMLQSGGEDVVDGSPPKPIFEHTWIVKLQDKGLGVSQNLVGQYYLCLSDLKLCLVKVSDTQELIDFPLVQIRSCGCTESFFYMDVGRQSKTGAGELWMLTEDANIARNMTVVIQSAFTRQRDADPHRKRSSSATEMNRPQPPLQRRLTHGGQGKPLLVPPYSGYCWSASQPAPPTVSISPPIDVCYHNVTSGPGRPSLLATPIRHPSIRRHSVSAVSSSTWAATSARAVAAAADVTDGAAPASSHPSSSIVISHQRTKSCPVSESSLPLIAEPQRVLSQSHVSFPHAEPERRDRRGSGGSGSGYRRHVPGPAKCTSGARERCDSMPSRNRTSSEGTHKGGLGRPTSMHMRGVSYSPPGPCLTDSAGSSLSIDDSNTPDENTILEENADDALQWPADPEAEAEKLDRMSLLYDRPPASLSLPIGPGRKISAPGALHGSPSSSSPAHSSDYMNMSPVDVTRRTRHASSPSTTSDYLPMSPGDVGKRAIGSPSSTSDYLPFSPADSRRPGTMTSSPSNQSDYMPMSPASRVGRGSSAATSMDYLAMSPLGRAGQGNGGTNSMDYLPMSPQDSVSTHSATSRRADSGLTDDGYVPMAPAHSDDGYVDMDPPSSTHRFPTEDHTSDVSPGSSSVTSGTPSSDHYLLEKVSAYLTHSEEDESHAGLPARTYSFGSQPQRRLEVTSADSARVRAFSMGNQQRPTAHKLTMRPVNTVKFSSAPLLSSSWSGSSRPPPDPMADLMELDFSKKSRVTSRFKNLPVAEASVAHNNSSADSGYMDMSSKSPPRASPPKAASSKHFFSPPDGKSSSGRKPPHVIASSTLKTIGERPDIKPQKFPTTSSANLNILTGKSTAEERPYVEMKGRTTSGSSVDGYMDMTPGVSKMSRKNSSDSLGNYFQMRPGRKKSESSLDYMHMSCKRSSQPIAIVAPSSPTVRTNSFTTPPQPPNYLPLETTSSSSSFLSSIRRKKKSRKKTERRDSKENITTPTGIFPLSLNSPQSPKKAQDAPEASTSSPQATPVESLSAPLGRVLRMSDKGNPPATSACSAAEELDYALMRPPSDLRSESSSVNRLNYSPRPVERAEADSSSRVGRGSTSSEGTCESCRLKGDMHAGVSRQVSTSSSSSTEVMSVKEGLCGAERDLPYAALDHGGDSEEPRSPRPSPAPSPAPLVSYAEIDFQKGESLRAPTHSYRKIRH